MMADDDKPAIEALRSACDESRVVLDHHINLQNELDDKALRTVRLSLVLLAIVISVIQLLPDEQFQAADAPIRYSVGLSVGLLVMVVFFGIALYIQTDVPFGVGPSHRQEVIEGGYSEREWLELLLEEYDRWDDSIQDTIEFNARWVTRTQLTVAISVMYLFVASASLFTDFSTNAVLAGFTIALFVILLVWYLILWLRENDAQDQD